MRGEIFNSVEVPNLRSSNFDLSHWFPFSGNMGMLIPILCEEVLPGDSWKLKCQSMNRMAAMLAPIMHRVNVFQRYFFVPNRLIWDKWEDFITGGKDGTLEPAKPYFLIDGKGEEVTGLGTLFDYLGFPAYSGDHYSDTNTDNRVDVLPFKAYQLIWNEYFRDQNLQDEIDIAIDEEGEVDNDDYYKLRKPCWEKDYFTSALPFAQRGPAITIPIGTSAPVTITDGQDVVLGSPSTTMNFVWSSDPDSGAGGLSTVVENINGTYSKLAIDEDYSNLLSMLRSSGGIAQVKFNPQTGRIERSPLQGVADLSQVTGITINDLRFLERTQEWSEINALGGGRYNENTWVQWKEQIPDLRLFRPRYLGGGIAPMSISEVLQTAQPSDGGTTDPTAVGVGSMYGHGINSGGFGFKHHFVEHGWLIGVQYILPKTMYFQGLPRKFTRFDKFDYAWYRLAHLGEQEVLNKELYLDNTQDGEYNERTFGYQSRYAEYKYIPDRVAGDFRESLSFWHMARKFAAPPVLNGDFVEANPTTRIFAVESTQVQKIYSLCVFSIKCRRKLPKYAHPRL